MPQTSNHLPPPLRYTADDLLSLPYASHYELVAGELVERKQASESSCVGGRLHAMLAAHVAAERLGWVFEQDAGFQCFGDDPDEVRKPDVSFVRYDRLPDGPPQGHCRVAPDLAVEVIAPHETYTEIETKVDEYLAAGVRLVWVVNPPNRSVRVHRPDGTVGDLRQADELAGEDVVPGFRCAVAALFAVPSETSA
ncbi:MAG TPA: Uma2 family endonuclease [Tepidisphaeraceae bacterium]|nr:Uma2 family endonuclease [Tepidisphaeraceae bacterium]